MSENAIGVTCPECDTEIEILNGDGIDIGDSVECDDCGELLTVTGVDPITVIMDQSEDCAGDTYDDDGDDEEDDDGDGDDSDEEDE